MEMMVENKRFGKFEFKSANSILGETYYEIVCYYPNPYYNRENEFVLDSNKTTYHYPNKPHCHIHANCFKNQECCYTVLMFEYDANEPCYETRSICDRTISSCDNEQDVLDLHTCIRYGFDKLYESIENE